MPLSLRAMLRRRRQFDLLIAGPAVPLLASLAPTVQDRLMVAVLAGSVGTLFLFLRWAHDMERIRAFRQQQDIALQGRGVSIADWHRGKPLAPWPQRARVGET